MFPFLYVGERRVNHLSYLYVVEILGFERMDLGRKGILRVILILISFLRCLLLHLRPPLRLDLLRRVVLLMTSSLMMDRRMMGRIVCFHTASADSWNLLISDHALPCLETGSISTCPASEKRCGLKAVARADLTYS